MRFKVYSVMKGYWSLWANANANTDTSKNTQAKTKCYHQYYCRRLTFKSSHGVFYQNGMWLLWGLREFCALKRS